MKSDLNEYHLQRLQEGDIKVMGLFYEAYKEPIYQFSLKLLAGNCQDAEDVTVQAILELWKKRQIIRNLNHAKNFVYQVAKHLSIDILRKKKKYILADPMDELSEISWESEETSFYEAREIEAQTVLIEAAIAKEIAALAPKRREVIQSHWIEGKKIKEIARKMKTSIKTTYEQNKNGLKQLRESLKIQPDK